MEAVLDLRYLRRLLTETDNDWPVVAGNIRKAPVSWERLARVYVRREDRKSVVRKVYLRTT